MRIVAATGVADTGVGVILGVPTGISMLFPERVAPGVRTIPATTPDVDAGLGVRVHIWSSDLICPCGQRSFDIV